MIPELSESAEAGQVDQLSHPLSFYSPDSCTRMSYGCIYGVPHYLLVLIEKATELTMSLKESRSYGNPAIPIELSVE